MQQMLMRRLLLRFSLLIVLFLLASATFLHAARPLPAALPEKSAVPDAAALRLATAHIQQVYRTDIAGARTPDAKATLASKMLQTGIDEKTDVPGKYALLDLSRTLATEAGRSDVAMSAVDELDGGFQVDGPALRVDTLLRLSRGVKSASELKPVSEHIAAETEMQLAADRYAGAQQLAEAEFAAAKRVGDISASGKASARALEIRQSAMIFDEAAAAQKTLATNPSDPAASQSLGKFRCFVRGDWDAGLKFLTAGPAGPLKSAAMKELAGGTAAQAKADIADAWWDIAETEKGPMQRQVRQHAGQWYQDALPDLAGLVRSKVQQRIEACSRRLALMVTSKHGRKGPLATGVTLVKGQTFVIEPNLADTWGAGKKATRFDYRGDSEKAGHMALMWKVGDKSEKGETVVAGKLIVSPAAGPLLLYCNDEKGRDNQGSLRVTILVR